MSSLATGTSWKETVGIVPYVSIRNLCDFKDRVVRFVNNKMSTFKQQKRKSIEALNTFILEVYLATIEKFLSLKF